MWKYRKNIKADDVASKGTEETTRVMGVSLAGVLLERWWRRIAAVPTRVESTIRSQQVPLLGLRGETDGAVWILRRRRLQTGANKQGSSTTGVSLAVSHSQQLSASTSPTPGTFLPIYRNDTRARLRHVRPIWRRIRAFNIAKRKELTLQHPNMGAGRSQKEDGGARRVAQVHPFFVGIGFEPLLPCLLLSSVYMSVSSA